MRTIRYRQLGRKTDRKRPDNEEAREQIKLVDYLRLQYPKALFCASAGGMRTGWKVARQMKLMGYVSGHPDIAIYEPKGGYCGLFIEMKRCKGGVVSEEQRNYIASLLARGYFAAVANGFNEAKLVVDNYFSKPVDSVALK